MIKLERIHLLNEKPIIKGAFVLYWMQQAQRIEYNPALQYAFVEANRLHQPLVICFVLIPSYPEANERHYAFLLEGLTELRTSLLKKGISFLVCCGDPVDTVLQVSQRATCIITDRGYIRIQRLWRQTIAEQVGCRMVEIETEVVVPVELVSDHEEYAARTIRTKIHRFLSEFLIESQTIDKAAFDIKGKVSNIKTVDLEDQPGLLKMLVNSRYPGRVSHIHGGYSNAKKKLNLFISNHLADYNVKRNDPTLNITSGLSPYLHFGQISSLEIAMSVLNSDVVDDTKAVFLEELIVRRELSMNFCWYNSLYDSFEGLPKWARQTLLEHSGDYRPYTYSYEQLENADTHDPYWNTAQREVIKTGMMHNYMRMYWGKKILEWIPDPISAFEFAIYLNNKYALDGRDPNSFAGIAWCFGKHDRPWATRPVFGTVRTMTASGLERKFDMNAYILKN